MKLFAFFDSWIGRKPKDSKAEEWARRNLARRHEERDPEENLKTAPPPDERINVPCFWTVELYLPSQLDDLIQGVRRLGWAEPDSMGGDPDGLDAWIRRASSASSTSSKYLQTVTRPGDKRFLQPGRHASLPDGVDYATSAIHCRRGTIFAVVMQFVLEEEMAGFLEAELRRNRKTEMKIKGSSWSYQAPMDQKRNACINARKELRDLGESWFKQHLPGYFSASEDQGFPTAEAIMFRGATPYERLPLAQPMNYMWIPGMDREFDVYSSADFPGLRVGLREWNYGERDVLILAANEHEFFEGDSASDWESWGGRSRVGYANRLSEFQGTLVTWSLHVVQGTLEKRLAKIRNEMAAIDLSDPGEASKKLQASQSALLQLSSDVVSAGRTVERISADPWLFHLETDTLMPIDPKPRRREIFVERAQNVIMRVRVMLSSRRVNKAKGKDLFENIRQRLIERTSELRESERELRETILAQGTFLATYAQERATRMTVRLQWVLALLTLVLIALTVVLVAVA